MRVTRHYCRCDGCSQERPYRGGNIPLDWTCYCDGMNADLSNIRHLCDIRHLCKKCTKKKKKKDTCAPGNGA